MEKQYVKETDQDKRKDFIEFLEKEGFEKDSFETSLKEDIIESKFPILVMYYGKKFGVLHTATSAAAAGSSGSIIDLDEFYANYDTRKEEILKRNRELMDYYSEGIDDAYLSSVDMDQIDGDRLDKLNAWANVDATKGNKFRDKSEFLNDDEFKHYRILLWQWATYFYEVKS